MPATSTSDGVLPFVIWPATVRLLLVISGMVSFLIWPQAPHPIEAVNQFVVAFCFLYLIMEELY